VQGAKRSAAIEKKFEAMNPAAIEKKNESDPTHRFLLKNFFAQKRPSAAIEKKNLRARKRRTMCSDREKKIREHARGGRAQRSRKKNESDPTHRFLLKNFFAQKRPSAAIEKKN